MKVCAVLSCLLAVAAANPQFLSAYAPHVTTSQFHAQDELGQYSYGYSGGPSAKQETRTADGITRGSYSYVDGHGLVQSTSYVADPVNGFRVAATNLPVGPAPVLGAPLVAAAPAPLIAAPGLLHHPGTPLDTPEVVAAKAAHFAAHGEALARLGRKKRAVVGVLPASTLPAGVIPAPLAYNNFAAYPRVFLDRAALFDDGQYKINLLHDDGLYKINPYHDDGLYRGGRRRRSLAVAALPAVVPSKAFAYSTLDHHVPLAAPVAYSAPWTAPLAYSAAHVAAPLAYSHVAAPVVATNKFHAQDELGQYSYGYNDGLSTKHEARGIDGTTAGAYSYLDSHGIVQSVKYVADAAGFRVAATNLPVGPA